MSESSQPEEIEKEIHEIAEYFEDKFNDSSEKSVEIRKRGRPAKRIEI